MDFCSALRASCALVTAGVTTAVDFTTRRVFAARTLVLVARFFAATAVFFAFARAIVGLLNKGRIATTL
jgi:hypothetical protein